MKTPAKRSKENTVLTKHPTKTGRRIDVQKYEVTKKAILSVLAKKPLTHTELFAALAKKLKGKVDWNIFWYGETLKLDLEARKIIKRTNDKPQKYQVK
jgi:hypothetical protein